MIGRGSGDPPARAWLVPETVQTSSMDCGPAALKALCAGFGRQVAYARLREACQTDVDGTSISAIEDLAVALGLDAEQLMLPPENLLLDGFPTLPAIAVVVLPSGFTHFVLIWRLHGPLVQVMDPARGRVWLPRRQVLADLYRHRLPIAAADWRAWAGTEGFCTPLALRLHAVGVAERRRRGLIEAALADPGWRGLGLLDAATRLTAHLVEAKAVRSGGDATGLVTALVAEAGDDDAIPPGFWSVRPDSTEPERLVYEAALIVRVTGRRAEADPTAAVSALPRPVCVALTEPPPRPAHHLWQLLGVDRTLVPVLALLALLAGAGAVAEVFVLWQMLFRVTVADTAAAISPVVVLFVLLLFVELALMQGGQFLGRRLELGLRRRLYEKLRTLGDEYFRSRLVSDMAQRAFELRRLRDLPTLLGVGLRSASTLLFVAIGIVAVFPAGLPLVAIAVAAGLGTAVLGQVVLHEPEMRQRTYAGALGRHLFDALLGLLPVRSHQAEAALRQEHEDLTVDWVRSGLRLNRLRLWLAGIGFGVTMLAAIFLVRGYLAGGGAAIGIPVLLYLSLRLPELSDALFLIARQLPDLRATVLRLLEPLQAPDESRDWYDPAAVHPVRSPSRVPAAAAVVFDAVTVRAAGRPILEDISLVLAPGEHVAMVGPSGAGKSSLAGLLLGWYRPSAGQVRVDGDVIQGAVLERLRRQTAWVDAQVRLWNRSLADNLAYGTMPVQGAWLETAVKAADLQSLSDRLDPPDRPLGEGGRLISGGEGQRVRLGRGQSRHGVRLAILDEPFRGLDRGRRRQLLEQARAQWRAATLLYICHDVADTAHFDRVLVIEGGRIVEDDRPTALLARASRYRTLTERDRAARRLLWGRPGWRRWRMVDGVLTDHGDGWG